MWVRKFAIFFFQFKFSFDKFLFHNFEINEKFGNEIITMLLQTGFVDIELKKDANDKERMIKAVKK